MATLGDNSPLPANQKIIIFKKNNKNLASEIKIKNSKKNGKKNKSHFFKKYREKGYYKSSNLRNVIINISITFMLLFVPIFMVFYFNFPGANFEDIFIDGEFQDWEDKTAFTDDLDTTINPNIDITTCKVNRLDQETSFYIEVDGKILEGQKNNNGKLETDTVRIFIDGDSETETGYMVNNIGADYLIEIQGKNGDCKVAPFFIFDPTYRTDSYRPQNDWNGWRQLDSAVVSADDNKLEAQYHIPYYANEKLVEHESDQILAVVQAMDTKGNLDMTEEIISNDLKILYVNQKDIAADVLIDDVSEMLELELTAHGTDITVNSISFTNNGGGKLIDLPLPIYISEDSTKKFKVKLDTSNLDSGTPVSVRIDNSDNILINEDVPIKLTGDGAKAYVKAIPDKITIDGVFADWDNIEKIQDKDTNEISNPNINISNFAVHGTNSDVSFYLDVEGSMLQGSEFPLQPRQILSSISERYHVSLGFDEINDLTNLPPRTGEDSIYIFLDTDHNYQTGFSLDWFTIGADYMIEIWGESGKVKKSCYQEFAGTNSQSEWKWEESLGDIETAIDKSQLESQISLEKLGIEDIPSVYFHIVDWSSGLDAPHTPYYAPDQVKRETPMIFEGVRGVTGQLLINELVYHKKIRIRQYIEIANPTNKDLGKGYYIHRLRRTDSRVILTLSGNVSRNMFEAFNPTSGKFHPGDRLLLKDSKGNIIDVLIVPNDLAQGDSYQRYIDCKDSNPKDTGGNEDFFTGDFYIAELNTLNAENSKEVPEFQDVFIPIISIIVIALVLKVFKSKSKKKR